MLGTWGSAPSPQVTIEMVVMGVTESSHPAHADVVEDHTPAQYSSVIGIPMLEWATLMPSPSVRMEVLG